MPEMHTFTMRAGGRRLELGPERTLIMGVVNVTPDSFSDGGRFFDRETAIGHALKLVDDGADILDIGGESTRPYSDPVTTDEELRRVLPVIEALAARVSVPISIDTTRAEVARRAIAAGAAIINDVSALRMDPRLTEVAVDAGVPVVLMHMKGTPKTMQLAPVYADLIGEIKSFLRRAIDDAVSRGIDRRRIIVDPGIGFGKTLAHNLTLIHRLGAFSDLDVPLLIGPSRKAFIRKLLRGAGAEDLPPLAPEVGVGTQAAVAASVLSGAHIVRVHDVAAARATVTIADAIRVSNGD